MWQRFTEQTRRVILFAQEEAARLGENYVGTEHLLLGLVRKEDSAAARLLERLGVNLGRVRQEIERQVAPGDGRLGQEMQLTPRAKRVIDLAYEEARQLNSSYIGTEHLLLGLVREGEGIAGRALARLGVDPEAVRREAGSLPSQETVPGGAAERLRAPLSDGDRAEALRAWRDLRFGLFLHWGLYSLAGGVWKGREIEGYNEQIQHRAKIPGEEYAALASQLTAERFDPDAIARLAQEAGMRYVVITAKHHDGFCLFHTKLSPFNAVDAAPFGRDAVALLAEACARHGLRFGVYYSLIDWHYPGAPPMSDHNSDPITPALEDYSLGQLRELLTGYGPLCEVWFDMGKPTAEQSRRFAGLVRQLQSGCLVSGRVWNDQHDFMVCGDNEVPEHWYHGAWESPCTVHPETWGYRSWGEREPLEAKVRGKVRQLAFVAARGGNLLLNVGPRGDGSILEYEADVLRGIGDWLRDHGEAVFGADPEPHLRLSFGYATSRPGWLYLFVAERPADGLLRVPRWRAPSARARILGAPPPGLVARVLASGAPGRLAWEISEGELRIHLPEGWMDPRLTVVAVECPDAGAWLPTDALELADGGSVTLAASDGLPWHRAFGEDYYSQRAFLVAREWVLAAPRSGEWRVTLRREGPGPDAGYLISTSDGWLQALLPAAGEPVSLDCGRLPLLGNQPTTLRLQSIAPGKELLDEGLSLELTPA